jgi:RNA polymerase sigma-70 factor (ECF subfamily)
LPERRQKAQQQNSRAVLAQGRDMRRSSLQKADDTKLIAGAAKGDREAFGALYERYVFKVFRHVYYLTSDLHSAEDLTAQTFLKALEAIHRYEMRGVPFLAWLLRIAYNLTINHKKVRDNGTAPLPEAVEVQGILYSPEASCEAKADGERVWEGVRTLRGDQRQVIVMRFIDGLSYSDVAKVLGKSIGAVRVIQYRALCALRRRLEDDLGHYYAKSRAG